MRATAFFFIGFAVVSALLSIWGPDMKDYLPQQELVQVDQLVPNATILVVEETQKTTSSSSPSEEVQQQGSEIPDADDETTTTRTADDELIIPPPSPTTIVKAATKRNVSNKKKHKRLNKRKQKRVQSNPAIERKAMAINIDEEEGSSSEPVTEAAAAEAGAAATKTIPDPTTHVQMPTKAPTAATAAPKTIKPSSPSPTESPTKYPTNLPTPTPEPSPQPTTKKATATTTPPPEQPKTTTTTTTTRTSATQPETKTTKTKPENNNNSTTPSLTTRPEEDAQQPTTTKTNVTSTTTTTSKPSQLLPIHHDNNTNTKTDNRPIFVLHIGPHKTATSTLQCELAFFRGFLFRTGRYTYMGRTYRECRDKTSYLMNIYDADPRPVIDCLNNHNPNSKRGNCQRKRQWKYFEEKLIKAARAKLNVIFSDEAFARLKVNPKNLELLFTTIQKYFQLRVVIVYRHYYSWLASQYNENMKPSSGEWPTKSKDTFLDWYTNRQQKAAGYKQDPSCCGGTTDYLVAAEWHDLHIVSYLKKKWSDPKIPMAPKPEDVVVLDMHDTTRGKDVVVNFVEQAMSPDMAVALQLHKERLRKSRKKIASRKNPSMDLVPEALAVEAHLSGILPKYNPKLHRHYVPRYVRQMFAARTSMALEQLPTICPSEVQIQQLRNRTLFLEETVFGQQPEARQQQHRSDFEHSNQGGKFCSVDAKKVLENEKVRRFFQTIH